MPCLLAAAMMMEIALRRKRRSAAVRRVGRRRIRSIFRGARYWVEQRKQHQARQETADMRLPGDAGAVGADRDRSDAEDDVDAEPDCEKAQHAAVAQGVRKRQCR